MGVDLAGLTTLTASAGLVATYGGNQVMKMGSDGVLQRYNVAQSMFRAGGSGTAAAVSIGAVNTWNPIIFNATNVNVGTCYSTSNGRFTAPVAGVYLFVAASYCTGAGAGWYVYSMFWVNGTATAGRPSTGGLHRIHGHGHASGYSNDTESLEMIPLAAGDYVNFYNYNGGFVNNHIPQYGHFEGYLLG